MKWGYFGLTEEIVSIDILGPVKGVIPKITRYAKNLHPTPDIKGKKCPTPDTQNSPQHSTPIFQKDEFFEVQNRGTTKMVKYLASTLNNDSHFKDPYPVCHSCLFENAISFLNHHFLFQNG